MTRIARMLTGLLMRSAWLLGPPRAEWLEGLVAEATNIRAGRDRVAWLLGGVWLLAGELLRRSAIRALMFIAAAGIVVWVVWPGSSSDYAVPVNRIVVPGLLVALALLPLLVRRSYGPPRPGLLLRTLRVVGYLVVLALLAGHAVQEREGQKLGAYFGSGIAGIPMSVDRRHLRSRARRLHRRDPDPYLTTHPTGPPGPARRDRDRNAHRRRDVRTLQLSPLERGPGNVGTEPGLGMVGVRRAWTTPADRLRGCTTCGPRHARERRDSRTTGRLGRGECHRNGDPGSGGAHGGHDRDLPPEGAARDTAAPGERRVRNVRPQKPRDPARPQTRVLGRTQHRPSRRSVRSYRLDAHHRTHVRAVRRRSRHPPRPSLTPRQPPRLPADECATRTLRHASLNAART